MLFNKVEIDLVKDNEEVTLMNYGNAIYSNKHLISKLNGDPKTTHNKLLWVPKLAECIDITIIDFDNNNNIITTKFIGEPSISEVCVGDFVQFMKMDYYKCKEIGNGEMVFIRIP